MRLLVGGLRYATVEQPFLGDLRPYQHQASTLALVREALAEHETLCILNSSVTGSGKTLASFAPAILDGVPTIGVYPTNELMCDQEGALRPYLREDDVVRIDSAELDRWQDIMQVRGHTEALLPIVAAWEKRALLTNPDILHLMAYDLYGYSYRVGYRERIFQAIVNEYPVLVFDEFHLYDTKQVANVAFIVGTLARLAPDKAHVFIFSSATPRDVRQWAEQRLGLRVEEVTAAAAPCGRIVCEPIEGLTLVPADLNQWRGLEAIEQAVWPELKAYLAEAANARGVFIVDSVYDARSLAGRLARQYGRDAVGEIHGYMEREARAGGLERRFTVGTTTIDVGVDLTGSKAKDFIVFEARSGAQFTQRLGRLGRRGREQDQIEIPNRAWALVPHYVANYAELRLNELGHDRAAYLPRDDVLSVVEAAYRPKQGFHRYWRVYSPLEAAAAARRILVGQLTDRHKETQERLRRVICELFRDLPRDAPAEEVARIGSGVECSQREMWEQLGRAVERLAAKGVTQRDWYLDELEVFRAGGDFQVALYDTLDELGGLFPFKIYNLPFVLRRTEFREISKPAFQRLVRQKAGQRVEAFLRQVERAEVLGYLRVESVLDQARRFWFQIEDHALMGRAGLLTRSDGWEIASDSLLTIDDINRALGRQQRITWFAQQEPWDVAAAFSLPPMFQLYPMRPVGLTGRSTIGARFWSVAFGLNAFFLDTVTKSSEGAIIC